jgi:hypothetical protein
MNEDDFRDDLKEYSEKDPAGEPMNYEDIGEPEPILVEPFDMEELDEDLDRLVTDYLSFHLDDTEFVNQHPNLYALLDAVRKDPWFSQDSSRALNSGMSDEEKSDKLAEAVFEALKRVTTSDAKFEAEYMDEDTGVEYMRLISGILINKMLG